MYALVAWPGCLQYLTETPQPRCAPLRPAAATDGDDGYHGHSEGQYCNSMTCPNGYASIMNAHDMECKHGRCGVKQCCKASCSTYKCPDNHTRVRNAGDMKCDDSGCSSKQCCHHGKFRSEPPLVQASVAKLDYRYIRPKHIIQAHGCCATE